MVRTLPLALVGVLALAGCGGSGEDIVDGEAAAQGQGLRLVKVGSFEDPVHVTAPPGDRKRLYVVEQEGRIVVRRPGGKVKTFLDIRNQVIGGGEQGLLSLAFAPDYRTSRRFYVYYTANDTDQRVVEYRARSKVSANRGSARLVLEMADSESNHNGGMLLFGPDERLYVGTGDGGGGGDEHGAIGNAQNRRTLLGKILRIDPRPGNAGAYSVPRDNPFYMAKGTLGEIYAYGLRNPWRFAFDPRGGIVIGDVGQDALEEISYVPASEGGGAATNFGWRAFEGSRRYTSEDAPGHVPPVITLSHGDGNCSITGGVVARDRRVRGAFNRYLFGDYCRGEILSAKLDTPRVADLRDTGLKVNALSSFGVDGRGRTHVVSLNGPVYRLASK